MLRSARRLGQDVAVDRFHWQRPDPDGPTASPAPVPLQLASLGPEASVGAPRDLTLPSISAERAAAIEREAFAKGYAEGERAGDDAAAERVSGMIERLVAAVDDVAALRVETLRQAERDILRLAIAIAERITRRELSIDPDLIGVMARVAIERLGENVEAAVHLHPSDAARVTTGRALARATVVADPNVARGGCIVRSSAGSIDLGIEAQIRELSRELIGEDDREDAAERDARVER